MDKKYYLKEYKKDKNEIGAKFKDKNDCNIAEFGQIIILLKNVTILYNFLFLDYNVMLVMFKLKNLIGKHFFIQLLH